jgi:signal transduction histidine kinase
MRGLTSIDGEAAQLIPLKDILGSMKRRVADDLGQKIIEPVNLRENMGQIESYGVYGNPYLIIHAMKNIINNGFLFARRSAHPVAELVIEVDEECKEGFVRILVSNNGPAISAEHEPNIFRMGFSSYGRRGTGLNVSQSILRESGGSVSLEDNGRDSGWVRFSVVLPISSDLAGFPTLP